MEHPKNKLYLCLGDNGHLSLETRYEVDSWLKSVEEGDSALTQTVVGSIDLNNPNPYFFVVFMMGKATTIYDVVDAADEEAARVKIASKKRYAGKLLEFKRVQNLSELTSQYKN